MPDLTNHEFAVLLLADEGESLIPIGIWEKQIKPRETLGLLKKNDEVNYVITEAGRLARKARDDNDGAEMSRLLSGSKTSDVLGTVGLQGDGDVPSPPHSSNIGLNDE